jgi:hypothetical protein
LLKSMQKPDEPEKGPAGGRGRHVPDGASGAIIR